MFFISFAMSLSTSYHPRTVEWLSINLILSSVSTIYHFQFWIKHHNNGDFYMKTYVHIYMHLQCNLLNMYHIKKCFKPML